MRLFSLSVLACLGALVVPSSSQASVITGILSTSTAQTGGPFGTVTATDVTGGFTVDVALTSGYKFVETGGHTAFVINLDATPTSSGLFSPLQYSALIGPQPEAGYGSFSLGVACATCSNGNHGAFTGALDFTVYGLTTADITANSMGYFFGADVVAPNMITTGAVVAGSITHTTPVPEPISMAMFGVGITGLALSMRGKQRA